MSIKILEEFVDDIYIEHISTLLQQPETISFVTTIENYLALLFLSR